MANIIDNLKKGQNLSFEESKTLFMSLWKVNIKKILL